MSSPSADEPVTDLSGLDKALDLLILAAAFGLAGLAIGATTAELIRLRGLAWTWGLLSAPICLIAATAAVGSHGSPPGIGAAALLAGLLLGATSWGLSRRIEDRRAGGDRELAARDRVGVLDRPRRRLRERLATRSDDLATSIALGRDHRGRLATIRAGTAASGSHVLVPGATGAGKTTTLAALLTEYVCRHHAGAIVIEAKVDRHLEEAARAAAAQRRVPFRLVSPQGECVYDPLANGDVDERAERLISAEAWGSQDADFYRQAASPFLRQLIGALDLTETRLTLPTVAGGCDPDELGNLAERLGPEAPLQAEILALLDGLRDDERRAIAGLRARLFNLAASQFARAWLDPASGAGPTIALRQSVVRREVTYFRLDTDRTGHVGKAIAQMLLLDLGAVASSLQGRGVGTFVAIDEFGALEASALDRLYARGRSAGFSVALGTQTVADLRAAGEAVQERVGGTVESLVCHRIGNQDDAEWIAKLIGTVGTWQTTIRTGAVGQSTDEGTRTRGHRFEVNPTQLQRLKRGEAVVARLDRAGARRSMRAKVVPAAQRIRPNFGSPGVM